MHASRTTIATILGLAFARQSQALSYYVDTTCVARFGGVLDETQNMATRAKAQLADSSNDIMADALKQIFKIDKSSSSLTQITNAFGVIGSLTSSARESADVRFYCDNDAAGPGKRWQLVPDIPGAGKKSRNSRKPPDQQLWWDPVNLILRGYGPNGCQAPTEDGDLTQGQTFQFKTDPQLDPNQNQNPNRAVISICDAAFVDIPLLSSIDEKKDLTQGDMEDMDDFLSITVFHELCHVDLVAGLPGAPDPVGWYEIKDLDAATALIVPDCYAFLGLSAILNDRNFRLATDPTQANLGKLEFIVPPKAANTQKRGLAYHPALIENSLRILGTKKRGISYANVQKGPALANERVGSFFTA